MIISDQSSFPVADIFSKLDVSMFEDIYGYSDIKRYLKMAFKTPKPISVLFEGPPASAKSMFLEALENIGGRLVVGSKVSKAGLTDILINEQPPSNLDSRRSC